MKVFNLTSKPLAYRGQILAPNGGSSEFRELDVFISDRDWTLVANKVIAFNALPVWWATEREARTRKPRVILRVGDKVTVLDDFTVHKKPKG